MPSSAISVSLPSRSVDDGDAAEPPPPPRPHSGDALENYVIPPILRHQAGGMEVIKVSKVRPFFRLRRTRFSSGVGGG